MKTRHRSALEQHVLLGSPAAFLDDWSPFFFSSVVLLKIIMTLHALWDFYEITSDFINLNFVTRSSSNEWITLYFKGPI